MTDIGSDYDSYWEDRVRKGHFRFTDVHRKIIETAVDVLGTKKARVLDCGVGPGHVMKGLAEHYDVYGIEISKKAFELYDFDTEKIQIWDLNGGLPPYPEKMDMIIASRIVHHLKDPEGFIGQIRENLKDTGWFIGITPINHPVSFKFSKNG